MLIDLHIGFGDYSSGFHNERRSETSNEWHHRVQTTDPFLCAERDVFEALSLNWCLLISGSIRLHLLMPIIPEPPDQFNLWSP